MSKAQNHLTNTARVKTCTTSNFPSLGSIKIGEMVYDTTTNRLYVRIISGWRYIASDG